MADLLSQVEQPGPLNNKCIVYQPNALKAMCDRLQHDQQLRIMPFGTLDRIKKTTT